MPEKHVAARPAFKTRVAEFRRIAIRVPFSRRDSVLSSVLNFFGTARLSCIRAQLVNGTVRSAVCYRSYHPIFGGLRGSNLQEISKVIQSGLATHPVKLSRQRGGVSGDLYLAFHRSLQHGTRRAYGGERPRDVMYFTQAPKLAVPRNPNELNQVVLQRYGC